MVGKSGSGKKTHCCRSDLLHREKSERWYHRQLNSLLLLLRHFGASKLAVAVSSFGVNGSMFVSHPAVSKNPVLREIILHVLERVKSIRGVLPIYLGLSVLSKQRQNILQTNIEEHTKRSEDFILSLHSVTSLLSGGGGYRRNVDEQFKTAVRNISSLAIDYQAFVFFNKLGLFLTNTPRGVGLAGPKGG